MADSESIRFAGDVSIEKIEIISTNGFGLEVTNQVIAIEIFEDLFSPFISGNLTFKDSLDLINLFPFVGEEFVTLKIKTPTFNEPNKVIDGRFYLYKLSDREFIGDRNLAYRLHFMSPEAVVDLNKKNSKTYSGKISDIAQKFITDTNDGLETNKKLNVEETTNDVKYVSNYWTPVQNLMYICGNATNKNNSANYIFFENRTGFNFVSLESLYSQPITQTFIYDWYMRDFNLRGQSVRNVEEEYKRIITFNVPNSYDYLENTRSGMYASKLISFDILTKKYVSNGYDMVTDFNNNVHLNKFPLTSNKSIRKENANILPYAKYYGAFTGYGDVSNAKTIQKRISTIKQSEGNKVEITVPGRTDYTVGSKVELKLHRMEPIEKESTNYLDNIYSGNYIISAINHYINREKHECTMQLIKDSYMVDLDKGGK